MDSLLNFGMSKVDGAAEAAGFSPWGQSAAYSVKNAATGMYLAAHKDGELVAEDNDLQHHDLVWRIFEHPNGSVALQSCHGTWLQAHGNSPNSTATEPAAAAHWKLGRSGHGGHTLQSHNHQFLSAVPPVEGEPAVLLYSEAEGPSSTWVVGPISATTALLSRAEGAVF